jgi:hypothetical protein
MGWELVKFRVHLKWKCIWMFFIPCDIAFSVISVTWVTSYSVWLQTGRPEFYFLQRQSIFLLALVLRPALKPTQRLIQWVPGVLSPGVKLGRAVALITHPHVVPRWRMSRSYVYHSWLLHGVVGQLYFYVLFLQNTFTIFNIKYSKWPPQRDCIRRVGSVFWLLHHFVLEVASVWIT